MKTLLCLALAGLGLLLFACRHNADPVTPVAQFPPSQNWVAPPVSPTVAAPPLPITDVAALTSVMPPLLTVLNCRIVKEVLKEAFDAPASNVDPDPENIVIDGKTVKVNRISTIFYNYDEQGRIRRITYGGATNANLYKSFSYDKEAVYTEEMQNWADKGLALQRDTILLNKQGYQRYEKNRSGYERLYDADGYFMGYKSVDQSIVLVENRNQVKLWSYFLGGAYITSTFAYNLTQPGLPNKFQYLGKNSPGVNLKTKVSDFNQGYNAYRDGLLRTIYYYYKYDQQGRIIAEIAHDKNEPGSGYYLGTHAGGLGITYYEYECP